MKYTPIYTYILLILFVIITIIGSWMSKKKEAMRTLPRPTRHPLQPIDRMGTPVFGAYQSETMNQFIDIMIGNYFDDSNVPYSNTVELYKKYCVSNGNASKSSKSKLTDIGYYILDIVIPNIPTVNNPTPKVYWPPIQWSGRAPFAVHISPRPTYLVYAGDPTYSFAFQYHAASEGAWNINNNNTNTHSKGTSGESSGGSSSDPTSEPETPAEKICGSCSSCMATALGLSDKCSNDDSSGGSSSGETTPTTAPTNNNSSVTVTRGKNGLLAYTSVGPVVENTQETTIGASTVFGYTITDASQNNITVPSPLNELITKEIINKYFFEKGPNQGRPTQAAIDLFNQYTGGRNPMDDFHKNKLRDMTYYVMQHIIPGLPTPSLPRSYVEWSPIVWLSKDAVATK